MNLHLHLIKKLGNEAVLLMLNHIQPCGLQMTSKSVYVHVNLVHEEYVIGSDDY